MNSHRPVAALLAALIACGTQTAGATDASTKNTARALAQDGERDFKAGRFAEASQKFQRAYAAVRIPTLARSAARALAEQGNLVAAAELYVQAIRSERNDDWTGNTQQAAQEKAQVELAELEPRIPRITITIEGASTADVEVSVDDVKVPSSLVGVEQRVNPGMRRIVGRRGSDVAEQKLELKEREAKPVALKFEPAKASAQGMATATATPAPATEAAKPSTIEPASTAPSNVTATNQPPSASSQPSSSGSTQRTLGWVGIGIGAAGIVFGTTTGIITGVKYGALKDDCGGNRCVGTATYGDRVDSYSAMRTMSTIGFIVGGVGAAAGITLLLTSPKRDDSPAVGLFMTRNSAGLEGAF
jgi:hypothetical protein